MIPQRRNGTGTDTFTYLCQERDDDGKLFSDEAIINQMTFLLFAAHDTTTSALSHMVYYTALHTPWQQRLRNEVLALHRPCMAYEDIEALKDIDLVFHESLRLHPSVPMMTRRTIRECELGGYRVPANTVLFLPPTYNHHMDSYWSNPQQFDPERFSEARQEHKKHSFQYLPFGGGAHKCIGMHFANMVAKAFMVQFLQQYSYALPPNHNAKITDFPLPHPADGLRLQLTRRPAGGG
jgi:cytochrome P450